MSERTRQTADPAGLLAALSDAQEAMTVDSMTLIECESPSNDLEAVARSAALVARIGRTRLGVEAEHLVVDACTHLRWRFGAGPRRVLVLGHHDTVWPIGSLGRHPVQTSADGVLRGPGCLDMKVGIVMAFHALAALDDLDGVTLMITGDEEIGSPTSRTLIEDEARGCDAVLVLEAAAPGGALKVQRKGRAKYEVHIRGRAAHAGLEPEKGVNATVEMAHQLLAAQALSEASIGTSVTPGLVRGGSSANTVADSASFCIDVRAVTTTELDRVDQAVHALEPVLAGAELTVTGAVDRPPLERHASKGLFETAASIAALLGERDLRGVAVGGGSDGNLTAALGVPTLDGLGAVGDGAHADHEHVLLEPLPRRTALVAMLVDHARHMSRPTGLSTGDAP